jgi:LysM domain-containing protein
MVSVRRVAPILLLAVAIPALAEAPKAKPKSTSHPPRELHRVGDHWTPYNPPDPATYPPGAKTYTIKPGDTLWGLAQQFLNNGYLWPQLWESNTWITDAHWIYPGDVLLLEGEIAKAAQQAEAGAPGAAAGATTPGGQPTPGAGQPLGAPAGAAAEITAASAVGGTVSPVPLATEADIYCYGYIGDPNEPMPNRIAAWEDAEVRYRPGVTRQEVDGSTGDLVFLYGGTATGLNAGDTYIVIVEGDDVENPRTHQIIGRQYIHRGQLRILCADANQSRGIVTQSCGEIPIGSRLKPMLQVPIPLARVPALPAFCDPASGKTTGLIVSAQGGDWLTALGEGQLVQVNLGRDDQVQPGEFLTVFRDNLLSPDLPRQILGELAILTSEGHTSTAKIVIMRYAMRIGDHVEIR